MIVTMMHVSMMHVSMMHVSMMLVSMMRFHDVYIPDACFQDAYINVSMMHICMYPQCKYPWSLTLMHVSMMRQICSERTNEQGDSRSWIHENFIWYWDMTEVLTCLLLIQLVYLQHWWASPIMCMTFVFTMSWTSLMIMGAAIMNIGFTKWLYSSQN